MQHLQSALVACDVQLVARPAREGASPVRANLRRDSKRAKETEGAARNGGVGDVDVDRDLSPSSEMHAARGMKEPRKLRQAVALAARRDRRELAP